MTRGQAINKILEAREILAEVLDATIGGTDLPKDAIDAILAADTALNMAHSCSCVDNG